MRIGIDIKAATGHQRSGIGNYVYNLVNNLNKIDNNNNYILIDSSLNKKFIFSLNKNFCYRKRNSPKNLFNKFDVFHGPDFKIQFVNARKKIVTIHDLASFSNDGYMSKRFEGLTKKKIKEAINHADLIITVSNTVKQEMENLFTQVRGKVQPILLGLDDNVKRENDENKLLSVKQKYNLPEYFILFVGNIETRKNLLTLLKAFKLMISKSKTDHHLVLVGKPGFGFELINDFINIKQLHSRVKLIGWVAYEDLYTLYSLADIFVFPSTYEGFGLPVLEAMRCKIPLVISDIPTNKEIAKNAAIYFNKECFEELTEVMNNLINDKNLKKQNAEKGFLISENFSWLKTAQETLRAYQNV